MKPEEQVTCVYCGEEQGDQGRNVICDFCGKAILPFYDRRGNYIDGELLEEGEDEQ